MDNPAGSTTLLIGCHRKSLTSAKPPDPRYFQVNISRPESSPQSFHREAGQALVPPLLLFERGEPPALQYHSKGQYFRTGRYGEEPAGHQVRPRESRRIQQRIPRYG